MSALLVHQGLEDALAGEKNLPNMLSEKEKKEIMDKAYSALILSLGDWVLREVSKEEIAAAIWLKLEALYMTKPQSPNKSSSSKTEVVHIQDARRNFDGGSS